MAKLAFLLGLYVVPVVLLVAGHAFRRHGARGRAGFWGAIRGYFTGMLLVLVASLLPPEPWSDSMARSFLVQWSMLLLTLIGFVHGRFLRTPRAR